MYFVIGSKWHRFDDPNNLWRPFGAKVALLRQNTEPHRRLLEAWLG
jgi:hypothetical protein